jgi:hypothetical protein
MGTRSTIALEFADGTVEQVYCHWDGYLAHNGQILFQYYSDPFKLRDLIDLGDLSSLGRNLGNGHPFSKFGLKEEDPDFDQMIALCKQAEEEGWTTFYGRDRGETGTASKKFKNYEDYVANHQYEEYEYILRNVDGKATWFVADHGDGYIELDAALEDERDRIAQEETA